MSLGLGVGWRKTCSTLEIAYTNKNLAKALYEEMSGRSALARRAREASVDPRHAVFEPKGHELRPHGAVPRRWIERGERVELAHAHPAQLHRRAIELDQVVEAPPLTSWASLKSGCAASVRSMRTAPAALACPLK